MSQVKSVLNECCDCGDPNPPWASLNRCVLVCDACCSVHRSLGRHLSQVKSLTHHQWRATQLKMLKQIVTGGSNKVWEYQILDPKRNRDNVKKPRPSDPLHPVKADFIKQKYQLLAFCKRYKQSELCSLEDMNMQLHASVRTPNLETSFRLLALGANPNFYHPHKRNTPLHVATQERQALQVELLLVYGASPTLPDARGATPLSLAERMQQQQQQQRAGSTAEEAIILALVEAQFELTDRFSLYLCGQQLRHVASRGGGGGGLDRHFLLPDRDASPGSRRSGSLTMEGRVRLATLPDRAFQELCRDLYDELDRRDNNRIVVQQRCHHAAAAAGALELFFLPLNPHYSSTRNQGRQKLGRLSGREFGAILADSLEEAARRCGLLPTELVRARFNRQQQQQQHSGSLDSIVDTVQLQQEQQQQRQRQQRQQQQRCKSEFRATSTVRSDGGGSSSNGRGAAAAASRSDQPGSLNCEDPVYDCVPADSEYASINPQLRLKRSGGQQATGKQQLPSLAAGGPEPLLRNALSALDATQAAVAPVESAPSQHAQQQQAPGAGHLDEVTMLRHSHARLAEENRQLKQRIDQLMAQNSELSTHLQQALGAVKPHQQHQQQHHRPSSPAPPTPPPPLPMSPLPQQQQRSRNSSASAASSSANYSTGCHALNTGVLLRAGIRHHVAATAAAAAAAASSAASPVPGERRPHTTIGQQQHHWQQHHHHHHKQHHQRYENLGDLEPPPPPPPPPMDDVENIAGLPPSTRGLAMVPPTVPETADTDDNGDDIAEEQLGAGFHGDNSAAGSGTRGVGGGGGVDIDVDRVGDASGGGDGGGSIDRFVEIDVDLDAGPPAAAAAAAMQDLDADYDQPPAESDDDDPHHQAVGEAAAAAASAAPGSSECLPPPPPTPPTQEEVVARTEAITAEIYKLLEAARRGCHESFPERAERVRQAVVRMTSIVPKHLPHQRQAVDILLAAADTLGVECREPAGPAELSRRTQQVIQCCFDIAKAAKALVTLFQ